MFPIHVTMYVRLAHREEREAVATFGAAYTRYATVVPAYLPHLQRLAPHRSRWSAPCERDTL